MEEVFVNGSRSTQKLNVLILMSDTGGGHRASAIALRDAFHALRQDLFDVHIVDFFVDIAGWPYSTFPSTYLFFQRHPALWSIFYKSGTWAPFKWFYQHTGSLLVHNQVLNYLNQCPPDIVISVHPMINHFTVRALQNWDHYNPKCISVMDSSSSSSNTNSNKKRNDVISKIQHHQFAHHHPTFTLEDNPDSAISSPKRSARSSREQSTQNNSSSGPSSLSSSSLSSRHHPDEDYILLPCSSYSPYFVPFKVVVTDYGSAHPLWFHPLADTCYVPSEPIQVVALQEGLQKDQLRLFGLPIRSPFWSQPSISKPRLKQSLDMHVNAQAVLILSGGDGVGNLLEITTAVANNLAQTIGPHNSQIVVVCGKNDALKQQLEQTNWAVPVFAKGFVSNMSDWMAACDCLITKAGPGTIAEALIRGLPMVISGYLPGQEEGNMRFVVDNRVGHYTTDPVEMGKTLVQWLQDPELLADMASRAKALGKPHAAQEIVRDIWDSFRAIQNDPSTTPLKRFPPPTWKYYYRYCSVARLQIFFRSCTSLLYSHAQSSFNNCSSSQLFAPANQRLLVFAILSLLAAFTALFVWLHHATSPSYSTLTTTSPSAPSSVNSSRILG